MLPANYQCEGQMSIFDFLPQQQFGRTSQELSAQEVPKAEISDVSSRNWLESKTLKFQYLCLTRESGCPQDISEAIAGLSHGEPMMHSIGECHSVEEESAFLPDSTQPMQPKSSLNFSEEPTIPKPSKLSQILEVNPDPKYHLSPKACIGILRRAEGKGKKLPDLLERTLKIQSGIIPTDDLKFKGDIQTYAVEGNGARPSHHGSGYSDGAMYTLNAVEHHSVCIGNGQFHDAISPSDEVSKTLNCMHDQQKVLVISMCQTEKLSSSTYKVIENHPADSRIKICENGIFQTLSGRMGTGGNNVPLVMENSMESVVRRLTPMECERLQGYPDGWTDIGEWTDSEGKKHKPADSCRYKALGNSIALPFWAELAKAVVAKYDHPVTMGSLFDGIGGFPLVFERAGAKAIWASEIEEFPIAVTKRRFPDGE